jgi:hypothetical protein
MELGRNGCHHKRAEPDLGKSAMARKGKTTWPANPMIFFKRTSYLNQLDDFEKATLRWQSYLVESGCASHR